MTDPLKAYVSQYIQAINQQDLMMLRHCLTINPGADEGKLRSLFRTINDFDLYTVPEQFKGVLASHIELMRAVYVHKNMGKAFKAINQMVNHLVRACESETNWVNPALMCSVRELNAVYRVMDSKLATPIEYVGQGKVSTWEQLVNTTSRAFKIVLNDKNLDSKVSKRQDIFFFIANILKVFFRMDKIEMARLVEKTLAGARIELPSIYKHKADACTYFYYSGLLALGSGEYIASVSVFQKALQLLSHYPRANRMAQQILTVLVPLMMYTNHKVIRNKAFWAQYPDLNTIYNQQFIRAIHLGDLYQYEKYLGNLEGLFLKRHLYLVAEMLRQKCQLNLVRRTAKIVQSLDNGNHIIPLSAIQVAFKTLSSGVSAKESWQKIGLLQEMGPLVLHQYTIDHIECILANLIAGNMMKGYISHLNKCVVLSKTNAFPRSCLRK